MATKIAKKINQWFVRYASEHIQKVDEDNDGLFVEVISESNEKQTYKVHCDESGLVPVATKCQCEGHSYGYKCKHMQAANLYYARIYKSNVEKAEQKVAEQEQVETPAQEEVRLPVAYRGSHKTLTVKGEPIEREDLSSKGNFGSSGFSLMKKVS